MADINSMQEIKFCEDKILLVSGFIPALWSHKKHISSNKSALLLQRSGIIALNKTQCFLSLMQE